MVRLTKIYTKVGDGGQTMLGDGKMVPKTSPRVEAYGEVDEANAAIGVAVASIHGAAAHAHNDAAMPPVLRDIRDELTRIQHDLFDAGADLCVPIESGEEPGKKLRIVGEQYERLERAIDRINAPLGALTSFILPGGTTVAANLHLARTTVRRAERRVAALLELEPARTSKAVLIYLNRLSDLLFVMARAANRAAAEAGDPRGGDVLWKPGATRGT
ncbi:MAG TPA: cob(I)yrinic acid a,c-diamide adenosyltransferase [Phycisphaerales bacterium]|nr:cob(I)yrinic acid a,c-diamide adenosyltransferase [Phycisphaerales bacterium]